MAEQQKHTEGQVSLHRVSRSSVVAGERLVASCGGNTSNAPGEDANGENEANARRLAACWNACIGIRTEALERGIVETAMNSVASAMEITRAESGLVEALEDAKATFALFVEQYPSPEINHVDYRVKCARVSEEAIPDIDAALAKAKPAADAV